jgi:hypothetical protein
MSIREKDPVKVAAGRAGAAVRWPERRHLRLDELEPAVRAAVHALITADIAAKQARESEGTP